MTSQSVNERPRTTGSSRKNARNELPLVKVSAESYGRLFRMLEKDVPVTLELDMRNRFYSPALNRFLQTDPIGFAGDALNLYRYCGDDPVDKSDPMGLLETDTLSAIWHRAVFFDSVSNFQGSYNEWMDKFRPQAGMDGGGGGAGSMDVGRKNDNAQFYGAVEGVEKSSTPDFRTFCEHRLVPSLDPNASPRVSSRSC